MRWSEIDFDKTVWRLPADRVKNNRAHEVPLTAQMLQILDGLPRIANRDLVFSTTGTTPPSGFSRFKQQSRSSRSLALNGGKPLAPWRSMIFAVRSLRGMAALGVNLPVIERC